MAISNAAPDEGAYEEVSPVDHAFGQPLFLWSGFAGPHDPYDMTESSLERYEGVDIPDPVGIPDELETKPPPQKRAMEGMDGKHAPAAIWWSRATPERIRRMRKHYYANITAIDDWVGETVAAIEARGELDNTVFVFTSDHGDCLGDHHQVYKFSSHYDSVARVPLVVAGPGVERLGVRDPLVELIDLGPTFLQLAGLGELEGVSGVSLGGIVARRGGGIARNGVFGVRAADYGADGGVEAGFLSGGGVLGAI